MRLNLFDKPTEMDKSLLEQVVRPGDIVVDATCGNGHDTVFLAEQVGTKGQVYAFDIQAAALAATKQRLAEKGYINRVQLIQDSHTTMNRYITAPVKAVMFNLGYLPGSDKLVVTKPKTTREAIDQGLDLLMSSGIMTLVLYQGHETGWEEARHVEQHLAQLCQTHYNVRKIYPLNYLNAPPYLIAIKKISRK